MLDRITATFDAFYSPTALAADRQPPAPTRAFFAYFLRQFRGALIARFLLVAGGSLADAMLPVFVGWTVGMLSTTPPGQLFSQHWQTLAFMLAVVLLRPLFFVADALVRNHAVTPNLVDLVRWQSHWHVIRQSWTFFQNDFAGRIGNKVMQAGEAIEMTVNLTIDAVWYAAVFVVVAVIALAGMDPLLLVPIALWLVAYALLFRWTMPNVDRISEEVSEARSVMTGRMVDSYTNIQTLKTFAVDDEEDAYVAEFGDGARRRLPAADGDLHLELVAALPPERAAGRLRHLDRAGGVECRDDDDGDGGDGDPLRAADHEHLGLDPRGRLQRVPPDRHGPRLHGDDRQAADAGGRAGRRGAGGDPGRDRL